MVGFRQRKRARYGRRGYGKRRRFQRKLGRRITRINRTLFRKGLKSVEVKYLTNGTSAFITDNYDAGNAIVNLTSIPQGTTNVTRIGNKIFVRHVNLHIHVHAGTTPAAQNEQYVKVALIRFKAIPDTANWSAGLPAMSTIFDTAAAGGADPDLNIMPFKYLTNKYSNPYTILWEKVIKVSKETGSDYMQRIVMKRVKVMLPVEYGDGGANTAVGPGQLVLYAVGNDTSATNADLPVFKVGYRTSFTDC